MQSKKFEFFAEKVVVSIFFRIFAVPILRDSVPNCLSLNVLREKGWIIYNSKVIRQCYNQRKQNLEGSKRAA